MKIQIEPIYQFLNNIFSDSINYKNDQLSQIERKEKLVEKLTEKYILYKNNHLSSIDKIKKVYPFNIILPTNIYNGYIYNFEIEYLSGTKQLFKIYSFENLKVKEDIYIIDSDYTLKELNSLFLII